MRKVRGKVVHRKAVKEGSGKVPKASALVTVERGDEATREMSTR